VWKKSLCCLAKPLPLLRKYLSESGLIILPNPIPLRVAKFGYPLLFLPPTLAKAEIFAIINLFLKQSLSRLFLTIKYSFRDSSMVEQLTVNIKRSSFGKLKDELFGITVKAKFSVIPAQAGI